MSHSKFKVIARALVVIVLTSYLPIASAAKPPKPAKKSTDSSGKLEAPIRKLFKSWDRDKDDSLALEELEGFYIVRKPKTKKKDQGQANQPDPVVAVPALFAKMDADQDQKVSRQEFDTWGSQFAEYATKYFEIQNRRADIEKSLAELKGLSAKSGNVTAGDGIFQGEANRGIIRYQQMIKGFDEELKTLDDEGGHAEYRDFMLRQLLGGKRR